MLPRIGDILVERYVIEQQIGAGGFSAVFRATDRQTNQSVALKLLKQGPDGYDRETRMRFQREAEILRGLRHPNIVRLLDYGRGDLLYLTFELVAGRDLARMLSDGPLDLERTTAILRQLLAALAAAHDAGVLHRDVKPENVRVTGEGPDLQVKLLDFGIARPTDDGSPAITKTGEFIGTPRYMSPEQLTEEPLGPPSDVYAAGIVGLEMLLGRNAMHGNRWMDQLDRLRTGHVFALPGLGDDGAALVGVLNRMTSRRAADRYPTAHAARHALDALGTPSFQSKAAPRRASESMHWPKLIIAALGVVGLLVAFWPKSPDEPTPVRPTSPPEIAALVEPGPRSNELEVLADEPVLEPKRPQVPRLEKPSLGSEGCGLEPMDPPGLATLRPPDYDRDTRHPLIVLLRDRHMEANTWLARGGFAELAEEHGFMVIAPEPLNVFKPWYADEDRSLSSVRSAVRATMAGSCIDPGRIFIVAHGYSALFAYRVACSTWVTGLATYAGESRRLPSCEQFDTPHLLLFPNQSRHQRPRGDIANDPKCEATPQRTLEERVRDWRDFLGLDQTAPKQWNVPGASCETFGARSQFSTCTYDGGHTWPGVPRQHFAGKQLGKAVGHQSLACDGPPPKDFEPAQTMWAFFSDLPSGNAARAIRSLKGARELDEKRLGVD